MTDSSHPYQGKVRLRACGVLLENEKLLLVKLRSPVTGNDIWTLPGGGVNFGESIADTISREVKEETGIEVSVGTLIHRNELIENDFHAVEMYHTVQQTGGTLKLGSDPEWSEEGQILLDAGFFSHQEIRQLKIFPDYFKDKFWEHRAPGL